jgi:hypothetical protein
LFNLAEDDFDVARRTSKIATPLSPTEGHTISALTIKTIGQAALPDFRRQTRDSSPPIV